MTSPAGAARARAAVLTVAIAVITTVHLLVTVGTHREHVVHILFRGLYLLPIVAGAVWFRLRSAILTAVAISMAYSAHIVISWHHQPMENANQLAMVGVFLFVGAAAGVLAEREERERTRRLESVAEHVDRVHVGPTELRRLELASEGQLLQAQLRRGASHARSPWMH
jgi:K+-sensing histidine kinase KdpD